MRILVTGGAGFIGSHTVVSLIEAGHEPVIVDNLSNARRSVIGRVGQIVGREPAFIDADIRDRASLTEILRRGFDACIHFAALKAVGESVEKPLEYYDNNVIGTIALLEALAEATVTSFVFSSSCTVYGEPHTLPLTEDMPLGSATNPYGWTKIVMEQVLRDLQVSSPEWSISLLRYFNPAGAHPSGLIGEDPSGMPTNVMPLIAKVAAGELPRFEVYGGDYPTEDGSGVRDYIHVMDLAEGHVAALEHHFDDAGVFTYNLGTGNGTSVLQLVSAYEEASGKPVPYVITNRRAGDVAANWADASKADRVLGWRTTRSLSDMCEDSWRWQQRA